MAGLCEHYPNKPIKVISDSAPGSAVDVTFRMAQRICPRYKNCQVHPRYDRNLACVNATAIGAPHGSKPHDRLDHAELCYAEPVL
jgi:hypothetical protein